jgi:hypothetical protein
MDVAELLERVTTPALIFICTGTIVEPFSKR